MLSQWLKTVFGKKISFADLFKKSQLLLHLLWLVTSWSRFEGYLWHLYRQTGFLIFWIEFAATEHARVNWIQPCAILCTKSLYRHLRVYGLSLNYYNISLIHCQMTIPISCIKSSWSLWSNLWDIFHLLTSCKRNSTFKLILPHPRSVIFLYVVSKPIVGRELSFMPCHGR